VEFDTLLAYLERIYIGFFFFSLILLLFSLLPFQLIKWFYLYKCKRNYFLISMSIYILINSSIVVFTGYGGLFLTSLPGGNTPFVVTLLLFSALVQTILYFFVDQYFLRSKIRTGNNNFAK